MTAETVSTSRLSGRGGQLGLYHFAILLPDRAALGRFVAHLARIGERAGASDHLVSEALYLSDPDGLGIEVYADRPRATWRYDGQRQLAMDTRPLDLNSLVQAAGGEPWTGMPAGTVMGHVHLHVGDIERAAAFYHAALGLDKVVWSYPGALFLSAGGYHHHVGLNTWAGPGATRPRDVLDAEIGQILCLDIDLRLNTRVGVQPSLDELRAKLVGMIQTPATRIAPPPCSCLQCRVLAYTNVVHFFSCFIKGRRRIGGIRYWYGWCQGF